MKQRKQKKKQRDILGGYSAGAPPLPIPNREVKPGRADGTAPQCGRVGRRPLFEERDALRRKSWGVPPTVFVRLCVRLCVLSRGPASPFRTELQFRVLRKGRGGLRRSRNRQDGNVYCLPLLSFYATHLFFLLFFLLFLWERFGGIVSFLYFCHRNLKRKGSVWLIPTTDTLG